MVAAVVAGCLLSACATPRAGEAGEDSPGAGGPVEALSAVCGMDRIYEWDGTPGSSTPAEALENTLNEVTQRSSNLKGVEPDPTHRLSAEEDPVLSMIAIRGLNALIENARELDVDSLSKSTVKVSALTGNGEEFASAEIFEHPSGGYRVDTVRVKGFVSDHPDC